MTTIRSHFVPDNIEGVQVGDIGLLPRHQPRAGLGRAARLRGHRACNNSELLIMPGETRTIVWVPERVGVFPFYCTDFCSALHQEMQGYIRVSPKGAGTAALVQHAEVMHSGAGGVASHPSPAATSGPIMHRYVPDRTRRAPRWHCSLAYVLPLWHIEPQGAAVSRGARVCTSASTRSWARSPRTSTASTASITTSA